MIEFRMHIIDADKDEMILFHRYLTGALETGQAHGGTVMRSYSLTHSEHEPHEWVGKVSFLDVSNPLVNRFCEIIKGGFG
jgi:hypothetical protein